MKRSIYLEGELALKFGHQHYFYGDSVKDALRLLNANNPEIRKYLIDAAESDIGFHIQVGDNEIEFVEECLLPLRNGDIVITPVPAGSKSGGAKILTAALIAAVLFIPTGGASSSLFAAATAKGGLAAFAAQGALGIATNLAISGIQQLMAPDPAVDSEDEGYLFNGSQQNIVEGMPIPLLYGELRVPGYPVSFELIHGSKRVTSSDQIIDFNGNVISYNVEDIDYEEGRGSSSTRSSLELPGPMSGGASTTNTQDILFTDIISEGPIYGLVDGGNSVYLNDDPGQVTAQSALRISDTPVEFDFTNGSTNVVIDKNGYSKSIAADVTNGTKFIIVRNYASQSGSAVIGTSSVASKAVTVTASSALFTSDFVYDPANFTAAAIIRLLDSNSVTVFEGYVDSYTSSTIVTCIPLHGSDLSPAFSDGSYTIVVDGKLQVASVATDETSLTLSANFPGTTGSYKCDFASTNYSVVSLEDRIANGSKYSSFDVQFRTGNLIQPAFTDSAGTGVGSVAIGPGGSFSAFSPVLYNDPAETDNPTIEYTGTSASGFGLTAAQVEEVDELRITFTYPQLWNRSESGTQTRATVRYTAQIALEKNGTFGSYQNLSTNWEHVDKRNAPAIFEEIIDLRKYQPFTDFKIKITRTTFNDLAYNEGTNNTNSNYTTQSDGSITSLNSIIKENLSYPLTAMAKVRVNSKDFQSVPSRTYLCKGLKVKVPSNYVTREEGANGVATYKRNVSTGAIESSYQDWDGNFRTEKVYTNNPAWIFYDILTNNRYGLGDWLSETEIDKYALYRIGRYCDELVDDGNGGTEPRFTCNVYFSQASDAYKVVKDLATVFRSMIYWLDGEIYTITDQPSDPVYNFAKSNVIDGAFAYETTGSKTRANQVIVTWTNPDANYKQENLIVEDRQNIIKTGRIISEEAVAFGATSEGQALRYGRWKLWTAVNQTEIVSFKTAINAAFLAPGDVINVQDSDRYPGHVKYSGRISNSGTRNTTTIPLDREITLNSGSSYELSVLFTDTVATLAQDSATIGSVSYSRGDVIDSSTIDTEIEGSNILDDSGNYVDVTWKPYTNVETQTVSTSSGSGITSLTVDTAFSTTPAAETVWVLQETISGVEVLGSKKLYKILSITEDSKAEYSITAVEFFNEKYAAVDETFVLSTRDPIFIPPLAGDVIPAPTNAYVFISDLNSGQVKNDVIFYWDAPTVSGSNVSSEYQYIDYYEVTGNIPGFPKVLQVGRNQRSLSGLDLPFGTFTVGIRTVAQNGQKSDIVKVTFTIEDPAKQAVPRGFGMALGGVSSSPAFITSGGVFTLEDKDYTISPIGNPTLVRTFDGSPTTEYTQDCSDVASIDFSALTNDEAELQSHYIMIDGDDSDPLKLIKYYKDEDLGYGYFYNAGTGNTTYASNWTSIGTVSVAANSNQVTGSGFSSSLQAGDIIKFSSTQAAKVVYVASNTDVRIDKSFSTAISSVTGYRNSFRFDKDDDAVIYSIRNDNGTFKAFPVNLILNPDLGKVANTVILTSNPSVLKFDSDGVLTTSYTNLVLTASAVGYKNPVFKFTGAGFNNAEISQTADTVFSAGTNFVGTRTLDKVDQYSTTDLVFTVTVAEELDESNTAKQSTSTLTIAFVKDGQDGVDGADGADGSAGVDARAVNLTVGDQVFTYDSAGSNPSPSSTTVTATAVNTSGTVYYEFFKNDVSVQNTTTATYSYSPPSSFASMPDKIEVQIREGSSSGTILARDQITISGVKPGTDGTDGLDGSDGVDAITTFYSNQAHTVPVTNTGTETWTGSGGTLNVFDGTTELVLNSNTQTTSYPTTSGRYNLNITQVSGDTLTEPSITGSGSVGATIGNFAGNLTQATQYELSIYVKATDGTNYNPKFRISITPSFEGADGLDGADGANGIDGTDGDNGLRRAEGYLYYQSAGTPSTTPSGIYTWSTGAVSGTNIGTGSTQWYTTPPEMGAGSQAQYYVRRWRAIETTANSTSTSLTIDASTLGHNFAGVVTFSSGDFLQDGSTITTIDGGNITTGTVNLNALNSSTSFSESSHTFQLAASGVTIDSTGYDTTARFGSTHTGACSTIFTEYLGTNSNSFGLGAVAKYGTAGAFAKDTGSVWGSGSDAFIAFCDSSYIAYAYSNANQRFYITTAGNGYYDGTLTVNDVVASKGTKGRQGTSGSSTGNVFNFWWTGSAAQLWVDTTNVGNIQTSSDYRVKDNIQTQTQEAISRINQIRPVTYTYADNPDFSWVADGVLREGFVAHELAEIIPSAVEGEKDAENQVQSLKLDALCSVLVKAIQEQQVIIQNLESRITALENS